MAGLCLFCIGATRFVSVVSFSEPNSNSATREDMKRTTGPDPTTWIPGSRQTRSFAQIAVLLEWPRAWTVVRPTREVGQSMPNTHQRRRPSTDICFRDKDPLIQRLHKVIHGSPPSHSPSPPNTRPPGTVHAHSGPLPLQTESPLGRVSQKGRCLWTHFQNEREGTEKKNSHERVWLPQVGRRKWFCAENQKNPWSG